MPAHPGAAEHAWKDGGSWRRGDGHAATVAVLTHDSLGHPEDSGGVFGTPGVALRAIMEVATTLGLRHSAYAYCEYRCPFLYATNGEIVWFRDARDPMNLSREVAAFHTPAALREMLERDFDGACERLRGLSNEHNFLRPYQREANAAVEQAIAERKRRLLVAMAGQ